VSPLLLTPKPCDKREKADSLPIVKDLFTDETADPNLL